MEQPSILPSLNKVLLTDKLAVEIAYFEKISKRTKVQQVKMNALTYVDLLKSAANEISRSYYKLLKDTNFIKLVNTMDRNVFKLS